jgi:hypothetical protein
MKGFTSHSVKGGIYVMVKKMIALVVFCSFVLLIGCSKEPIEQISEKHIEYLEQNLNLHIG